MTSLKFAPQFERDEQNRIRFPYNDTALRTAYFIEEANKHPAKANLFLIDALVDYLTNPGDTIMDITAGTGSLLLACNKQRRVILIELSPLYCSWIRASATKMGLSIPSQLLLLQGDCRQFLPLPVKSIIFSPPYAGALGSGAGIATENAMIEDYIDDPRNLSKLNDFIYNQEMEKVYRKCLESLPSGGTLSLIIKDRILHGKRLDLGLRAVRMMQSVGFRFSEWYKWKPHGNIFTNIRKGRGKAHIEDEHIIIMEKPK